jgi:hypothetical protein
LTDQHLGVSSGHRPKMLQVTHELDKASVAATASPVPAAPQPNFAKTRLSTGLGAEDPRSVIGAYHKCVAEPIAQFDWLRRQVRGDGVLIYFAYPQAHVDDVERALRAGLALRVGWNFGRTAFAVSRVTFGTLAAFVTLPVALK